MADDFRLKILAREIFYFLTALLLLSFILETIFPNIILAYFNLNYLAVLWLAAGLVHLCIKARR